MEPAELPSPPRERDHSEMGHPAEDDMAERIVARSHHKDDVTVHRRSTSGLEIDDPRTDRDGGEVRGRDRAEGIGEAGVLRALLRYVEISIARIPRDRGR